MTVIHLPGFLSAALLGTFGRSGAPENWFEGLLGTTGSIVAGVVLSSWGWIGVLAGGLYGSLTLNPNAEYASTGGAGTSQTRSALGPKILLGSGGR